MPFPIHIDAVATPRDVLDVQRLVDVADEVDDELGGLVPPPGPQSRIEQLRGVVLERAHDAAVGLAVALEVDAAIRGRAVLGVDEVEVLGEAAPFRVPDAVGPRGDAGEVVLGVVAQQRLEVGRRVLPDEITGDVGDGDVPQTCSSPRSASSLAVRLFCASWYSIGRCTYCPRQQLPVGPRPRTTELVGRVAWLISVLQYCRDEIKNSGWLQVLIQSGTIHSLPSGSNLVLYSHCNYKFRVDVGEGGNRYLLHVNVEGAVAATL